MLQSLNYLPAEEVVDTVDLSWVDPPENVRMRITVLGPQGEFDVRLQTSWARIGSDKRCEICLPELPKPVFALINLRDFDTIEFVSFTSSLKSGEFPTQRLLQGGKFRLGPYSLQLREICPTLKVAHRKARPAANYLQLRGRSPKVGDRKGFSIPSCASILGSDPNCKLRLRHRTVGEFHAVLASLPGGGGIQIIDLFHPEGVYIDQQRVDNSLIEASSSVCFGVVEFIAEHLAFSHQETRADSQQESKTDDPPIPPMSPILRLQNPATDLNSRVPRTAEPPPSAVGLSSKSSVVNSKDGSESILRDRVMCLESQVQKLQERLSALAEERTQLQACLKQEKELNTANQNVANQAAGQERQLNNEALVSQAAEVQETEFGEQTHGKRSRKNVRSYKKRRRKKSKVENSKRLDAAKPAAAPTPTSDAELAVYLPTPEREYHVVDRLVEKRHELAVNRLRWISTSMAIAMTLVLVAGLWAWGEVPHGWRELLLRTFLVK